MTSLLLYKTDFIVIPIQNDFETTTKVKKVVGLRTYNYLNYLITFDQQGRSNKSLSR